MAGVLDNIFGFLQPILTGTRDAVMQVAPPIIDAVTGTVGPIINGIWDKFSSVLDGMSWLINSIYEVIRNIPDLITSIIDLITSLVDYINPFSPNFFIKIAFIPSDGFFTYYVSEHFSNIMNSFWVVQLYTSVTDQLKELAVDSPKPIFQVNLPAKYGGTTVNVIDFSFYDEYRDYIHLFIKVGAWLFFIKSLVRRAPQIIYK